jgi:hypothetical protein
MSTLLEILANLLVASAKLSSSRVTVLYFRDFNEIMGSVLYGSWNDHHQLTCGDVMHVLWVRVSGT